MDTNEKDRTIKSMIEFGKEYFPESYSKQHYNKSLDGNDIGINWAKEAMKKVDFNFMK